MAILRLFIGIVACLLLHVLHEINCQPPSHAGAFAKIRPSDLRALQTFRGRQRLTKPQPDLSAEADVKSDQALASQSTGVGNEREAAGVIAPVRSTTVTPITTPKSPPIRSQRIDPIVVSDRRLEGNVVENPQIPFQAQEPQQKQTGPIRSSPLGDPNVVPINFPWGSAQTMDSVQRSPDNSIFSSSKQQNIVPFDSSRVPLRGPEPESRVPDVRTPQQSLPVDSAFPVPPRRSEPRPDSFEPLVSASSNPQFLPFDSPRVPLRTREPETSASVPSSTQDVLTSPNIAFDRERAFNNIMAPNQLQPEVPDEQPTALIWDHPPQSNYIFLRKVIVRRYRVNPCPGVAFGCYYMEPVLNIVYVPVLMA
ncbi:uncharacterized protein LOC127876268 [Dreissena polymorpha]|uniref:uncharacterized protein LOC127876268 n=1 Tax=Dreissena polymorpha TaxID=45954 RepID=UPI002264D07B|nr:uncharacterized protein LOC127876268 [Dreissena polymorpha]